MNVVQSLHLGSARSGAFVHLISHPTQSTSHRVAYFNIFTIVKRATLGNPTIMQKPYTRFYIHYLDINRMEEVLDSNSIPYFAMETRVSQINWVLHIPDEYRKALDDLVVMHNFNLSAMNHSFWYQDREKDAMRMGSMTKPAIKAIIVVLLVLLIVAIAGLIF